MVGAKKSTPGGYSHRALWLCLRVVCPKIHHFSDPTAYLQLANDFTAVLAWEMEYPFQHRLGLIFSEWVSMKVFGANAFGVFLPQLPKWGLPQDGDRNLVIFIDYAQAKFMSSAYKPEDCADRLTALAESANSTLLIRSAAVLLAVLER